MAPIKFEDDFKEKLDKRTIAPSNEAWNKLSERLENVEDAKNNKRLWWLGIAASVIGILLVASQFINNEAGTDTPVIVDAPETKKTTGEKSIINTKDAEKNETIIALQNEASHKSTASENAVLNTSTPKPTLKETQNQLVEVQKLPKLKSDVAILNDDKTKELTFETEKAHEVAGIINAINDEQSGVSDVTIDSLLKQAQKEILLNRMRHKDKALVDAALLLQEVEFELDKSFRDKVFKALKESYGTVKTAIAQRNE